MSKIADAARAGKYDILADLWLECLSGEIPVEEMIEVFSVLKQNNKEALAQDLLELVIEEMENKGADQIPDLLRKSACIFSHSESLRRSLIESIRDEYLMFQPLENFLNMSGLTDKDAPVDLSWKKFRKLMHYREGGYLFHHIFGPGRIIRISRAFITIDFQNSASHDMKLDVALDTTNPLMPDSLIVLRWCNPSDFLHLFNSSPAEFLKKLLRESFGNHEEITLLDLTPVFKDSEIKNTEAWKLLRKTASVTPGFTDLGDRIVLKNETIKDHDQIRSIINRRKHPVSDKTKELQALLKASGEFNPESMADLLDDMKNISSPETGSLFELSWILTGNGKTDDFMNIASNYIEKTSARGLRATSEIHSPSCRKLYLELFFSSDADRREKLKLITQLKRALWEHCAKFLEKVDTSLLSECIGSFLSNPSETDQFLWALCFLATHEGFDDSSFDEKQIKLFMDYLIFAKADTQKKVISLLMGSLKDKLDGYLSSTDTRQLTNYLDILDTSPIAHREGLFLAVGREISRRRESGAARSLKKHFWESDTLFSSKQAIEKRKAECLHLKQIEIPAAADAIGEAASHGDLSENAEYAAAIEKRDLLLDRLRRWIDELEKYQVYPSAEISTSIVSPGIRVELKSTEDPSSLRVFDIVGPLDADPDKSRINYMAPVGKIVIGKSQEDTVMLPGTGNEKWKIVSLEILEDMQQ